MAPNTCRRKKATKKHKRHKKISAAMTFFNNYSISRIYHDSRKVFLDNIFKLCDTIREVSFEIHSYLRHGHLEKVYHNAMINRLSKIGIQIRSNYPLTVLDKDGTILGEYFADLLVENAIIIEIKACVTLTQEHTAQLLGYLRASRIKHGLLINFGATKLQIQKYIL